MSCNFNIIGEDNQTLVGNPKKKKIKISGLC